ncbi:hypothetical protein S7711_00764 [Stachybotrys chartarum IBT 7711]|uniref:Zn(2)-C6 fungal-type domain-containing protein n=1 Tax=Stachybotrys chartarum (strain CBS 109288 / IBT 7711) TaxID=1280523 RepID=A0A084B043_STACB|nr:hypothetical protein S7711_00764 [Stachybotrys chartarum IBT 7711]
MDLSHGGPPQRHVHQRNHSHGHHLLLGQPSLARVHVPPRFGGPPVLSPDSTSPETVASPVGSSTHGHFALKRDSGDPDALDAAAAEERSKKKQKRNKPTLSCQECVERKTKCDRGRPHCIACIKRQTECKYAQVANLLEETSRSAANGRRMTKAPKRMPGKPGAPQIPNIADRGVLNDQEACSRGAATLSIGLLSHVPFSAAKATSVLGIGLEHPFANYWTCEGGLPEVVSVLPEKIQADILLNRYFECVDPVYPMIHRQTFYADYEHFWQLSPKEKADVDAAFLALIFVMLALGTQFVTSTSPRERKETAEFYVSASNQALRVYSYLSQASTRSIQAMVLITYFLINDNHASDGWAFAGILVRQAYALGLHRDPNIVTPNASLFEKQQRRKLWQAVLLQDTFLTVLLSLPPSATHTDVSVEDLLDDGTPIAHSDPTDTAYIRGSWTLANLVQESICSPRSLDLPICSTARHKSKLIADFRAVYRSFADVFRSWDPDSLAGLAKTNKRVVRQTLFLTSNYFHNLMLVHASESAEVPVNARATLEAAHDAISAFFMLFNLLESEARVWWVFNHRAFLEALCIGNVLREASREPGSEETITKDPVFVRARADIDHASHGGGFRGGQDPGPGTQRLALSNAMESHGQRLRCASACLFVRLPVSFTANTGRFVSSSTAIGQRRRPSPPFHPSPPPMLEIVAERFINQERSQPFTVDLLQGTHPCGPATVHLSGQPLRQDAAGRGRAVLTLLPQLNATVRWTYTCVGDTPREQVLDVVVEALNGEVVPDSVVTIVFRQTAPATILEVAGDRIMSKKIKHHAAVLAIEIANEDDAAVWAEPAGELTAAEKNELRGRLRELELLRAQAKELEKLIFAKETYILENFGEEMEKALHPGPPTDSPFLSNHRPDKQPHVVHQSSSSQKEQPITSAKVAVASPYLTPRPFTLPQDPAAYYDLVTALAVAGIAFILFTVCGIIFMHRRMTVSLEQSRRRVNVVSGGGHHETREERLARQAIRREARRHAISEWFKTIFRRLVLGDAEKDAPQDEEQRQQQAPPTPPAEEATTMEQELARFRVAATMVGDIIAAEEGRSMERAAVARAPPGFAYASEDDADSLPAYQTDEDDEEDAVVADGFRYMRPSSEFVLNNTSPEEVLSRRNDSDRLGYGK